MSAEAPESPEAEQGGVFGKLPASRPGTRSPRRNSAATAPAARKAKPASRPRPKPMRPEPPPARAPAAEPEAPEAESGGLDDLAWAGVAAIAEAATLGVRLANRALGALRGGDEPR